MSYDQNKVEKLLLELKQYHKIIAEGEVKPKILLLAKQYEDGISVKNPYLISKIKATINKSSEISHEDIANFIVKLKEKHFPSISTGWIYRVLPEKYKRLKSQISQNFIKAEEISDANLYEMLPIIKERIKRIERGPDYEAKDIKIKETVDAIEEYQWACSIAQELAKYAIKLEKEHKEHDGSLCAKFAKRVKTARDARFATTLPNYEAIVVACGSFRSLNELAEGEWEFKNRWEIEEDERNCRECLNPSDCAARKCKHICHKIVKPMTTKGLKYAIKTNDWLKDLDNRMKKLMALDEDLCDIAKILFSNPKTDELMNEYDKKRILASHIKKEDCFQCQNFLEEHKNFFKD
ncbi:MAG: hypothetical protein ACE5H1_07030 [Thermodesulfobacteriota bacterium]